MKKITQSIIFLLLPFLSFSQSKDFIVSKNLDTIYGKVYNIVNLDSVKIKQKNKKFYVNHDSILNIHTKSWDGRWMVFEPVESPFYYDKEGQTTMLLLEVQGKINIYNSGHERGFILYIKKGDSKITDLAFNNLFGSKMTNKTYDILAENVSDDSNIFEELKKMKRNKKEMIELIKKYNSRNEY
jgi:hypothetical protein